MKLRFVETAKGVHVAEAWPVRRQEPLCVTIVHSLERYIAYVDGDQTLASTDTLEEAIADITREIESRHGALRQISADPGEHVAAVAWHGVPTSGPDDAAAAHRRPWAVPALLAVLVMAVATIAYASLRDGRIEAGAAASGPGVDAGAAAASAVPSEPQIMPAIVVRERAAETFVPPKVAQPPRPPEKPGVITLRELLGD